MKIYPSVKKIIDHATEMKLSATATGNHPSGGQRRHHPLGSTFAPNKTVIIEGIAFSNGGAWQFLLGKRASAISASRLEAS